MIVYVGAAWMQEGKRKGRKKKGEGRGKFSTLTMIYRVNASITFAHLHVASGTDLIQHRHRPRT